jgi:hypothetical protein
VREVAGVVTGPVVAVVVLLATAMGTEAERRERLAGLQEAQAVAADRDSAQVPEEPELPVVARVQAAWAAAVAARVEPVAGVAAEQIVVALEDAAGCPRWVPAVGRQPLGCPPGSVVRSVRPQP